MASSYQVSWVGSTFVCWTGGGAGAQPLKVAATISRTESVNACEIGNVITATKRYFVQEPGCSKGLYGIIVGSGMNLPNSLTLLRIFFVPLLVAALVQEDVKFSLFGYVITNEWKQVTTIGTLLDPIADKLLVSAALISLVQVRVLPGWMAIIVVGREFAVSGLRSIAAAEGYTIRASDLGKTKMVSQVIAISCLMISWRNQALRVPGLVLMWGVVFFALLSAISYFRKFWRKVDESVKKRRRRELLILERKRQRAQLRRQKGSKGSLSPTGDAGTAGLDASGGLDAPGGLGASGGTIWKPPEVS
jgi:CDP-diacylglycerol--glycerol-3-phosphate 3-phosphatidyltransferase